MPCLDPCIGFFGAPTGGEWAPQGSERGGLDAQHATQLARLPALAAAGCALAVATGAWMAGAERSFNALHAFSAALFVGEAAVLYRLASPPGRTAEFAARAHNALVLFLALGVGKFFATAYSARLAESLADGAFEEGAARGELRGASAWAAPVISAVFVMWTFVAWSTVRRLDERYRREVALAPLEARVRRLEARLASEPASPAAHALGVVKLNVIDGKAPRGAVGEIVPVASPISLRGDGGRAVLGARSSAGDGVDVGGIELDDLALFP